MGRLVLLQTSPRVAPGLLSVAAWDALRAADLVLCGSDDEPEQRQAVTAAGVAVDEAADPLTVAFGRCAAGATVVWLVATDQDPADLRVVAREVVDRADREPAEGAGDPIEVEVLAGSYDVQGARLLDLVAVMDRLRAECPWDREQTHQSLARYLVEETYEVVEALDNGDRPHLREELGDLLLQVLFHSRIAAEHAEDPWTVDDVAADVVEKLVRRHPHVFAGTEVGGVGDVETNWETIKRAEKQRTSVLDGIPAALPALALAEKTLARAARLDQAPPDADPADPAADDLGDRLLALVVEARHAGVDPEQALRNAVRGLADRVRRHE